MRKLYIAAAVLLFAAALSGCAPRVQDEIVISELIGVPEQSSPIVGFSQLGEESVWRMKNTQSILDAAEERGIQLMYENAHQKPENQIKALRSFIAYQVDAIVLAPMVETGWEAVLQEALDAGIPVILEDREISDAPEGAVAAWTGSDFYAEGRRAAAYVLSEFKNTTGPVNILELSGTAGSTAAQDRHDGFRDTLGSRSRYRIIKSVSGDFMLSKGREVIRNLFDEIDPSTVDVLFSHNDDMTRGAIEAMEEHGLVPGVDIKIVTVDAQDDMIDLVREGVVSCAVECDPDTGDEVMDLVEKILAGEDVPERTFINEGTITKESLEKADAAAQASGSARPSASSTGKASAASLPKPSRRAGSSS